MWHIANATDNERLPEFEALPHEEYLLERQCRWPFMTAMARPLRFTISLPNQGVAKLTPVPPS